MLVTFSNYLRFGDELTLGSFAFAVFILLALSVISPVGLNAVMLFEKLKSMKLSKAEKVAAVALTPLWPAVLIYMSEKLSYLEAKLVRDQLDSQMPPTKEAVQRLALIQTHKTQCTKISMMCKRNESATEHITQTLVILLLTGLKFTRTSTVFGVHELFVGGSTVLLLMSSAWSVISIVMTYTLSMMITKRLSICGVVLQFVFASLSILSRIMAVIVYFAPSFGLFNLLIHWKISSMALTYPDSIYAVANNGTYLSMKQIWRPIENPTELTVWNNKHYFLIFLAILTFHFISATVIKWFFSKSFRNGGNLCKKFLHILHQGR